MDIAHRKSTLYHTSAEHRAMFDMKPYIPTKCSLVDFCCPWIAARQEHISLTGKAAILVVSNQLSSSKSMFHHSYDNSIKDILD